MPGGVDQPGIVVQHVHVPQRLFYLREHGIHGSGVGHVGGDGQGRAARRCDLIHHRPHHFRFDVVDGDVGALSGEAQGHGPPDPSARAGDEDGLASETLWMHHVCSPV
jgi:hypothetical protein